MLLMAKTDKKLTARQFDDTLKYYPRMTEKTQEAIRHVMVRGKTNQAAADLYGLKKQFVNNYVTKVYDTYLTKVAGKPPGWIEKTWCVPPKLSKEFDQLEQKALKDYYKKQNNDG